jgi:hypothetical protein
MRARRAPDGPRARRLARDARAALGSSYSTVRIVQKSLERPLSSRYAYGIVK